MKNKVIKIISILGCILVNFSVFAQEVTEEKQEEKKTAFTVGTLYQSDMQYLGRVDSIKTPLVIPNMRLALKNGIFAEAEGYFDNKIGKFDGGYIATGYEFDKENFGGGISLSKYFFNSSSNIVKSDISTTLGGYFYYNLGFASFNVEPNYIFSTGGDFVLGMGFSKEIEIENVGENGKIKISPKLYSWFGTESFTIEHIKTKGKKTTATNTDKKAFQLMSIEANLPVDYILNDKLKFTAEPELVIPYNYKKLGGFYASSEYPNPIFQFKIGVSYTL